MMTRMVMTMMVVMLVMMLVTDGQLDGDDDDNHWLKFDEETIPGLDSCQPLILANQAINRLSVIDRALL